MFGGLKKGTGYIIEMLKVSLLIVISLFLPRFFLLYAPSKQPKVESGLTFKLGLENISDSFFKNLSTTQDLSYRVGIVTNHTGVDQLGRKNSDILAEKGLTITALFYPACEQFQPDNSLIPAFSLYQKDNKTINAALLNMVDVLIFDIQDSGIRHFQYVTTLFDLMKMAGRMKKTVVVLDRPNLLGSGIEGLLSTQVPIPLRHGITIGELAHYFNSHLLEKSVQLHVVPMSNYARVGNNTPVNSCYGYSFLSLLAEVTPFDVGIGTDKAYQCILLPDDIEFPRHKWHELRVKLKEFGIKAAFYRYFNTQKQHHYTGLHLDIGDIDNFSSFGTLLSLLTFFKRSGLPLAFSPQFDTVLGSSKVREYIQGKIDRSFIDHELNKELQQFYHKAVSSLLYQPLPRLLHA